MKAFHLSLAGHCNIIFLLHAVLQRESISPLTSREGTTPNNSGDFKETDVVNDSLEGFCYLGF